MNKKEIIKYLVEVYGEDREQLKELSIEDLERELKDFQDHSDFYPNDDEYDGSHNYD